MGSNYYGEANMGNERGGGSSRKSKKDKAKQPQRGLGVAQLEKIRLNEQMGYHPSFHGPYSSNFNQEDMRMQHPTGYSSMMGLSEYDQRANISYGDSQPSTAASWNPGSGILDAQPNMTRQLLSLHVEDLHPKKSKSLGSSSQNSESSETQELDLELRLSL
ncbi:hypothetical protein ES319_D07G006700v1 [Gossypium barbadense]|uniref:Uncharacterized protein n=1 Tax=Gossypium barbadense TaxID=3634 RepID=A0A5J5QL03_GOSBA|nr:hypothetical protein ES319_D07G006700v1 [Gossypium barbadense]PPD69313.1 hypothetical protein GOBAR_DD33803 [Gossypium barbadense]